MPARVYVAHELALNARIFSVFESRGFVFLSYPYSEKFCLRADSPITSTTIAFSLSFIVASGRGISLRLLRYLCI